MNVLFVCAANSGRSVMTEQLFRQAAQGRHQACSAGSEPGEAPHRPVVEALREIGIDAADHVPRTLDAEALEWDEVAVDLQRRGLPGHPRRAPDQLGVR